MRGWDVAESAQRLMHRSPSSARFAGTFSLWEKGVRALLLSLLLLPTPALAEEEVDLELVLAIDASSSVDEAEWELQRQGYAAAFRDTRVQAALSSGPKRRVALSVLVWADATVPKWSGEWFVLSTPADGERFGNYLAALPRIPEGGTGIGAGLAMAIRKLDRNGFSAPRQVVDVSGDGRETPAREVVVMIGMAQAMARARGVTVNGLAILNEDAGLTTWYRDKVIAGAGSFVVSVADYADFAEAITLKLLREIEHKDRLARR